MKEEDFNGPTDILKIILESQTHGTVIGIVSPLLGRTIVLTGIESLILEDSPLVVLKPYDIYGYILPETKIYLEDITSVRPFTSHFKNPFESKLGENQNTMLA
jgi:hypothetical protein